MSKRDKYRKVAEGYLEWRGSDTLFRPAFVYAPAAPGALDVMRAWESRGDALPEACSEPELLADYVQGKRSRDWHITNWKEGIREGTFQADEFMGELGVNAANFQSIFGCAYTGALTDQSG